MSCAAATSCPVDQIPPDNRAILGAGELALTKILWCASDAMEKNDSMNPANIKRAKGRLIDTASSEINRLWKAADTATIDQLCQQTLRALNKVHQEAATVYENKKEAAACYDDNRRHVVESCEILTTRVYGSPDLTKAD